MRIRKNAKLHMLSTYSISSSCLQPDWSSSLMTQAHACQLNQSPWDVVPFSPSSYQFEHEDYSLNGNGSLVDSIGAVESVSSMMSIDAKSNPIEITNIINNDNNNNDDNDKTGSSNYNLSNAIVEGKRRIIKLKKHNSRKTNQSNKTKDVSHNEDDNAFKKPEKSVRRGHPRSAKKGSSGNPNEFYYYSGFGPRWGKKRGGHKREVSGKGSHNTISTDLRFKTTSFREIEKDGNVIEEFDFVEEDYDDSDDDNGDGGGNNNKRLRKLVKARSLKSLM